jgi:hypothetical protein
MGKTLVFAGLLAVGSGVFVMLGFSFGRLPGDLVHRRGGMTVYLPVASLVILSIALNLVLMFVRR